MSDTQINQVAEKVINEIKLEIEPALSNNTILLAESNGKAESQHSLPSIQDICISMANYLHYPTILADCKGKIVHKNSNSVFPFNKWRNGASLKRYIDEEKFSSILSIKNGDYISFVFDETECVVYCIANYFFVILLSELERNRSHINVLRDYLYCVSEKELSGAGLISDSLNQEQKRIFDKYERNFKKMYSASIAPSNNIYNDISKNNFQEMQNIVYLIKSISKTSETQNYNFSLKLNKRSKEYNSEIWTQCSSKDIGVILGTIVFLCLLCASSKKPNIYVQWEKNKNFDSCLLSFYVKSKMSEKRINKCFHEFGYPDECSLYFKTIRKIALQNSWGVDAEKYKDGIRFKFFIQRIRPSSNAFYESNTPLMLYSKQVFFEFLDGLVDS